MALDKHNQHLDPWLKTLKNKVEQKQSPQELDIQKGWEALSKELPSRSKIILFKPSLVQIGAIAATFFLAIGVGFVLWKNQTQEQTLEPIGGSPIIAESTSTSRPEVYGSLETARTEQKEGNFTNAPQLHPSNAYAPQEKEKAEEQPALPTEEHKSIQPEPKQEVEKEVSREEEQKAEKKTSTISVPLPSQPIAPYGSKVESFSSASNLLAYENALSVQAYANTTPSQKGKSYIPNQPLLRTSQPKELVHAQNNEYSYDRATFRHTQPFNIGFRLSYALNSGLYLESGIAYTYLRSNVFNLGAIPRARQQIHYLGVPIGVRLKVATVNRFQFYTASNLQIDKMLLAKIEKERLETRAWQFSLQGRAGVSYQISPNFSLFTEAGLAYYFDDNSRLHTFYKEHPLTFSWSSGIRIDY
ncbi:hypothetical protein [Porphyromonas circumdentaria]|uniref:hypothetical protein n=1 Tax=Porphyromonas circumdentaria TaxID=29524 RepID=UPI0026DB2B23|nr:hypothetical protein [Porphyromonas circumdentaria]MDO4721715.1 hypothetical protein [Porphyromonas circumdentaria]